MGRTSRIAESAETPFKKTNIKMRKAIISLALLAGMAAVQPCTAQKKVKLKVSTELQGPENKTITLQKDKDGYLRIFDGKTLDGWRGYGKDHVAPRWTVEDGALKFSRGEGEGGDIIFAHKFKNFILEMEWKVSKGANSGIFYLAQEATNADGGLEPIYISAPECQVLDNENHPDAKLGVDGNRKSTSLYDMIPAKPQNAKPYGEWNKVKIVCDNGHVEHWQNGVKVLEYELWTPEWTNLLQASKFSEKAWPAAFKLLNNCGGDRHEGLIGMQDHGDTVWFKNIRVKVLK